MSSFLAVRALHDEGVPKKAIARKLGLDRRTVRKYIKRIERGDGKPVRMPVPSKVEPFRDRIVGLVERGMSAVQVYLELKADAVCTASYSTVQRVVKALRPKEPEVYCRMKFLPGEEAQIDFGDVGRIEIAGKVRTMWLFAMTLCFSRYSYYDLVLDQTVPTFLGAIRRGFEFFGGVVERLKPDNLKSAVLMNGLGERFYQRDFYNLCKHYDCLPDAARPGTPTDKGRVERDIGYVKASWLRGRSFTSFEDALSSLRAWQRDVASVRIHGTTRRQPIELFEEERQHLRPLPADPYEIADFGKYRVRKDCHVQVLRNFYSVPWQLVGKEVVVRFTEREVTVFADDRAVATHPRLVGEGLCSTNPEHYPPSKRISSQEIHRRRLMLVREAGPHTTDLLGKLREGPAVFNDQLRKMAGLVVEHGAEAVEQACRRALHFGAADTAQRVQNIIERRLHAEPLPELDRVIDPRARERDFERPMAEYEALLEEVVA